MTKVGWSKVLSIAVPIVFLGMVFWQQQSKAAAVIQYKVVAIPTSGLSDAANLERSLNQLGAQGWELTERDGALYVFKK